MKNSMKSIAIAMATFALVLAPMIAPLTTVEAVTTDSYSSSESSSSQTASKCILTANTYQVNAGENVTLTWDTAGYSSLTLNGESISNSGSKTFYNIQKNTTYVLRGEADGSSCVAEVVVGCNPPPEPKECKLEVEKRVNKSSTLPGEGLTYTIDVTNTGDANCTGGGVRIKDVVDQNVLYKWHKLTGDIEAGYGSNPVYDAANRTLWFNARTLTPGESVQIQWGGNVQAPVKCGDFIVKNQAQATAKELNNFQDWSYSQTVRTTVSNSCQEFVPPACPIEPAENRIIVDFTGGDKLLSNKSVDKAMSAIESINLKAGAYGVTLVSWDGYLNRPANTDQIHEQWKLQFLSGGAVVTESGVIGDLADGVVEDTKVELVNSNLSVGTGVTGLRAMHAYYPDTSSANSVVPICAALDFKPVTPAPSCDSFTATPGTITAGQSATLKWETTNAKTVFINNGVGSVAVDGSVSVSPLESLTYLLTVVGTDNSEVSCEVPVVVTTTEPVPPVCPLKSADGRTIIEFSGLKLRSDKDISKAQTTVINHNFAAGDYDITLVSWDGYLSRVSASQPREQWSLQFMNAGTAIGTSNAISDLVDNVVEALNNERVNTNFKLTTAATGVRAVHAFYPDTSSPNSLFPICAAIDEKPVTPAPSCDSFTATPGTITAGQSATLKWETTNAKTVFINNGVGSVAVDGSVSVSPLESLTYLLTVVGTDNSEVSCEVPVVVTTTEPEPFSCANNVTFRASDTSIDEGDSTTLTWNVNDGDSVSISKINATSFSGSQSVSPSSDITYTLSATKGSKTISCPLSITVDEDTGGGGGGSASPRCTLDISDKKIKAGETVEITWNTSNATEVTLLDDRGEVIFTTEDYLAKDKKKYLDDSIKVKPTRDTEYTLLAERGSRDDECQVEVEVEKNEIVVLQTRDQQPLVAGISLSQVPYTGFEAGPIMTAFFYILLVVWALYITYLLVLRKRSVAPQTIFSSPVVHLEDRVSEEYLMPQTKNNSNAVVATAAATAVAPANLPIGTPTIGYENYVNPHQVDDVVVTELENRAHAQHALLSSDALRFFIGKTAGELERNEALDTVIAEAKKVYPLEDNWIVINEERMRIVCETCIADKLVDTASSFAPATIPEGSGSLAEAIVTGNVVAAYEMIGNRPMFALADASADLDAVYRLRKGGVAEVSDFLLAETERLSDAQLQAAIAALTSAIDGTYTDEASAVKMAIMKAVKAVA